MEGMPHVPMISIEIKHCSASLPPDFANQIKEYILIQYQDEPTRYDSAISEIENMRTKLKRITPSVETVNLLKRYYAQMCLMKNRFPMEEGDPLCIPFTWADRMDLPSAANFEDINYELACVMYNIGAVHSSIAATELRTDPDSTKSAFSHFQCAAFPFQYIRNSMKLNKFAAAEFDASLLTFYVNIMLAQAQECLLEKSINDHRKNSVIAMISIYLRDLYKQCREHLKASPCIGDIVSSSKYKEWLRICDIKTEIYGAIAVLHLGFQAEEEKKMGFRVTYYEFALEHVAAALTMVEKNKIKKLHDSVAFLYDVIKGKQTIARKENDFIYHERVPKPTELILIDGVVMVKPIAFDPTDRSVAGPDLFATLLPINVLKSVSLYSEEKANYKRSIMEKVAEKDKELNEYINSLRLEEIHINDKSHVNELPEMLLERSAAFNSQPDAFPSLLEKLQEVGSCAIEAEHKISDLTSRLAAITSEELRSDEGFTAIAKELSRITEHHLKARTNNAELQRVLAAHSENLKVLAMPLNELNKRLSGTIGKPEDSAEWKQLNKMLDKTYEMSSQRCALLQKLDGELQKDDITMRCLTEKNQDNQELYSKELKKHEETAKLIDLNLAAQEKILNALTESNAAFADYRKKIIENNKRKMEQVLALTAAYDVYLEVSQKAEEGLKFYSSLFSIVKSLSCAVEAIEAAFAVEKDKAEKELLRQLEERSSWKVNNLGNLDVRGGSFLGPPRFNRSSDAQATSVRAEEQVRMEPKLKDYLEYYRTKIANQGGSTRQAPILTATSLPQGITPPQTFTSARPFMEQMPMDQRWLPPTHSNFGSTPNVPNTLAQHDSGALSTATSNFEGERTAALPPASAQQYSQAVPAPQSQIPYNNYSSQPVYSSQFMTYSSTPLVSTSVPMVPSSSVGVSNPSSLVSSHYNSPKVMSSTAVAGFQSHSGSPGALLGRCSTGNDVPFATVPSSGNTQHPVATGPSVGTQQPVNPQQTIDPAVQASQSATQFTPIRMQADLSRNVGSINNVSVSKSSAVNPQQRQPNATLPFVMAPYMFASNVISPWHQPLAVDHHEYVFTTATTAQNRPSTALTAPINHSASTGNFTQVAQHTHRPQPLNDDLMSTPLEATLPAPLAPAQSTKEIPNTEAQNTTLQVSTPVSKDTLNVAESQSFSSKTVETLQQHNTPCQPSSVPQALRPAAAVAPIMQPGCSTNVPSDAVLGMTNVTSLSYTCPAHEQKTQLAQLAAEEGNSARKLDDLLNPQTFTVGEADQTRLEKRLMRDIFKAEGRAARLSPLNPADPINRIDAHYWFKANKP